MRDDAFGGARGLTGEEIRVVAVRPILRRKVEAVVR